MALPFQGGSDANRKTSTSPESRAIGITPSAKAGRAISGQTATPTSKGAGESSSLAPDYISPLKGYRLWQISIAIPNRRVVRMLNGASMLARDGELPAMSVQIEHVWLVDLWAAGQCEVTSGARAYVTSLNNKGSWYPGHVRQAECYCNEVQISHTCGIYATKDPARIMVLYYGANPCTVSVSPSDIPEFRVNFLCGGSVWLWGEVAEHETGYRAEYAYPAEFYYVRHSPQLAVAVNYLAALFDVPAVEVTEQSGGCLLGRNYV